MNRKCCIGLLLLSLALSACAPQATAAPSMPNPASVYCEKNGGRLEIRTDTTGGQAGVCVFPNGSECDEWAYFRGECSPVNPTPAPTEQPVSDWKTYHNETMGFSFQYPADATVRLDETGTNVFVDGPVVDNNSWPSFVISFPKDRPDFQVPANTDLRQWLIDHNLFVDQPEPDMTIAGTTAIHTHYPRGQQSYASDHFFFVHNGQMFMITILHTGDREDWALYGHFLQSFQFE